MKTRDIQRRMAAYVQLPHRIAEDPKYAGIYVDDHRLAAFVRLLWAADRSFPAHPSLPRAVDQATVDALAAVGLIALEVNDGYSVPDVDALRSRLAEAARLAGLASGESRRDPTEGERSVPDLGNAPFPIARGGTEREPTKTKTKTKTKTNVGSQVGRAKPSIRSSQTLSSVPREDVSEDEEPENVSEETVEIGVRSESTLGVKTSWCEAPRDHRLNGEHSIRDGRYWCAICGPRLALREKSAALLASAAQ
jgi:hypothetical protein